MAINYNIFWLNLTDDCHIPTEARVNTTTDAK